LQDVVISYGRYVHVSLKKKVSDVVLWLCRFPGQAGGGSQGPNQGNDGGNFGGEDGDDDLYS
jgi:hypothetical protein